MKYIYILFIFLLSSSCSLNKDSKFWTEDVVKKKNYKKKLTNLLIKSKDITAMTQNEYEIYIDDYTKKSEYPDLN